MPRPGFSRCHAGQGGPKGGMGVPPLGRLGDGSGDLFQEADGDAGSVESSMAPTSIGYSVSLTAARRSS